MICLSNAMFATMLAKSLDMDFTVLQQSCPVSTPLAGMPTLLKLIASVPSGDRNSWFLSIEFR